MPGNDSLFVTERRAKSNLFRKSINTNPDAMAMVAKDVVDTDNPFVEKGADDGKQL